MKKLICTSILAVLIASVTAVRAQDNPEEYLGLPGDNLNLYAVMKLFQESETLEAFERNLNDENSHINNLDLNGDNMVDYITVSDYVDDDVHNIVLRAALGPNEYQDVAVFIVQRLRSGSVQIQLIGDEDLYGKNYIVEPIYAETPNPGYRGRTAYSNNVTVVTTTYYEVAAWPVIRFIFSPFYVCWHSSWYWGYYPVYWHPWRPWFWHYYYGYYYHWYPFYYAHFRHWSHPRYTRYRDYYYRSVRAHSPRVAHRISAGNYRQTYSRPEQRRDGEALYMRTHGSRSDMSRSYGSSAGSDKRTSPSVSSRSSGSQNDYRNSEAARRSSAPTQSSSNAGQTGTVSRRAPAATSQRPASSASTRQGTAPKSETTRQSTTRRVESSGQTSVQRSQSSASQKSTVRRSEPTRQATVQRTQTTRQSTVQRSTSSRSSSPSVRSSGRSSRVSRSAPAAKSSSHSRSSQGKSSSSSSQKSSKSSGKSDKSKSSRR
jgi:hypothetical protein